MIQRLILFLVVAGIVVISSCSDDDGGKDLDLTSVEFRGDSALVVINNTLTMANIININGPDSLMAEMEYSSSDASIASFETSGVITGNAFGGVTVIATERNTGLSDDIYITVIEPEVEDDDE